MGTFFHCGGILRFKHQSVLHLQDPLRASDRVITSCGPYMMKEEDAMVYRNPYLTSGSSGFALSALSKTLKRELKVIKN